jgi:hypothetical protein
MKMELDKALEHEDVLEKVGVVVKTGCTMGKWCSKPQKRSAPVIFIHHSSVPPPQQNNHAAFGLLFF